jgi:bifunctional non-homologous end joining protein LigD
MTPTRDPHLDPYRQKRDPARTPEPFGGEAPARGPLPAPGPGPRFVVQKHWARNLHYDLRLELEGTLKSWAVPKGPSTKVEEKRLAVHVEDHPLEYADFEGVIPAGNYGAGSVIVWDRGWFRSFKPEDPLEQYRRGKLELELFGFKLRGRWTLVRMGRKDKEWLLLKKDDGAASEREAVDRWPESVITGCTVEEMRDLPGTLAALGDAVEALAAPARELKPRDVPFTLATLAEKPPAGDDWLFEVKYDGVRVLAAKQGDEVRLHGRSGDDITGRYPEVAIAVRALPAPRFLLDGEIVAEDEQGRPSFQRLQARMGLTKPRDVAAAMARVPVRAVFFDCPAVLGHDLRGVPLASRKALLERLLPRLGVVQRCDHVVGRGEAFLEAAAGLRLEGIVAKRLRSIYAGRRSPDWIKVKCQRRQEFVIGGWTEPQGSRARFGALHIGLYDGGRLAYVTKVGTGFDGATLEDLWRRLQPLARDATPFEAGSPTGRGHHWAEPRLVCEVRFTEWTRDGGLRHPTFLGLRDDRRPEECRKEEAVALDLPAGGEPESGDVATEPPPPARAVRRAGRGGTPAAEVRAAPPKPGAGARRSVRGGTPAAGAAAAPPGTESPRKPGAGSRRSKRGGTPATGVAAAPPGPAATPPKPAHDVRLTNLKKVFWPAEGYTKGDLVAYYDAIAPVVLPYLRDRPVVLTRYPDGIAGKSFFQKDAPVYVPDWVRTESVYSRDTERDIRYFVLDDADSLRYVANLGTIPIHAWSARAGSLETPDWLVLDLDPKEAPFTHVVQVARAARALLDELALPGFVKTSGASGLHVRVPMGRRYSHEETRTFARLLAMLVVEAVPEISTVTRAIQSRGGKVYVDFGQNGMGNTIVAPFSVRPLPGAPASCPLRWDEVTARLDPKRFTIRTIPARFAEIPDPLAGVLGDGVDMAAAIAKIERRLK